MKTKHEKIADVLKAYKQQYSDWLCGYAEFPNIDLFVTAIEQVEPEREYIQVDARDEHPKESGWYITSISGAKRCWFFAGHWYSIENPTRDNLVFPKWWLKKLTQPPQQPSDSAGEEVDRIETDLLDAINSGLRKWDYKKKLSSEDALELLFCLQDRIMDVKLTRPTVSEEEIYDKATKYAEENYADRNQHWDVIDGFIAGFKGSSCIISENDITKAIEGYSSPLSIRNRKEYESWRDGLAKAIKELLNR